MHVTFLFLSDESANPRLLGELASDLAPVVGNLGLHLVWGRLRPLPAAAQQ